MDAIEREARRTVSNEGHEVTHRFFEQVSGDGREAWVEATASPRTVMAIPDETGQGLGFARDALETDIQSSRIYYLRDDVDDLRDGGGDSASKLVDDGTEYVVMDIDTLDNGLFRAICWRED